MGHLAPQDTREGRLLSLVTPTDPPLSNPTGPPADWNSGGGRAHAGKVGVLPAVHPNAPAGSIPSRDITD